MIGLVEVKGEHRELLWDILQRYLREMAQYYGDMPDENGEYPYRYFDAYFTEPERWAYLLYDGEALAGFAMVNPYSYTGGKPDYVLAEFGILPMFRRKNIGMQAVECIFDTLRGKWELKYSEENEPAKRFWNRVTAKYAPVKHDHAGTETVLEFETNEKASGRLT